MSGAEDLTGRWLGIYNYPQNSGVVGVVGAVAFVAEVVDGGGRLGGTITENDAVGDGRALAAGIDGVREGSDVEFTKFYDEADPDHYDAVAYRGTVSADGNEISGRWDIPGTWSGTFIMTRPAAAVVEVDTAADERVR